MLFDITGREKIGTNMDISSTMGLVVLFSALAWIGYKSRFILKIRKVRRISIGRHDEEIKETILASNLRDAMAILTLFSIALFLLPLHGMKTVAFGSQEYTALADICDFAVGTTFAFGVFTFAFHILKRRKAHNLVTTVKRDTRLPRRAAKKEKMLRSKPRI